MLLHFSSTYVHVFMCVLRAAEEDREVVVHLCIIQSSIMFAGS